MSGQADPYTRQVNIQWVSAWSDIINKAILDERSGWPIYTSSKYSVSMRLIQHYQPDNIRWVVRLTHLHTMWIFSWYPPDLTLTTRQYWISIRLIHIHAMWILSGYSPDPILSTRQYWMSSQADPYTPQVNIELVSTWSNIINQTILDE